VNLYCDITDYLDPDRFFSNPTVHPQNTVIDARTVPS
jgi:hypothetical protein